MKRCFAVGVVLCLLVNASAAALKGVIHRVGARFGPSNCVSVTRSSEGTCVITTDCEHLDTSKTEFAFDCVGTNIVRHSFGFGGFDSQEEFDTDLKCDECNIPSPADAATPTVPVAVAPNHTSAKSDEQPVKLPASIKQGSKPQKPKARAEARSQVKPIKLSANVKHGSDTQKPKARAEARSQVKPIKLSANVKHGSDTQKRKALADSTSELKAQAVTVPAAKPVKPSESVKHGSNAQELHDSNDNHTVSVSATKAQTALKIWGASTSEEKSKKKKTKPDATKEIVRFGPNGCVSVYKSEEGHCIMSTKCEGSDTSNYEYGLVCVDKVGSPVKHLFGKDSFDPVESFDTLIKCNMCLGLEDVPDQVALAGEVATLAKSLAGIKTAITNMSVNLQMLNKEVFKPTIMPAAAPAPAAAAAPAPALATASSKTTSLIHHSGSHHKHSKKTKKHLRHSHFRHRHYHVSRHAEKPHDGEVVY